MKPEEHDENTPPAGAPPAPDLAQADPPDGDGEPDATQATADDDPAASARESADDVAWSLPEWDLEPPPDVLRRVLP